MPEHVYLACDLSAKVGRIFAGQLRAGVLSITEIHRFPVTPVRMFGTLRWDIFRIFEEIVTGMRKAAEGKRRVASISVDSWGSDYVWFNSRQPLLSPPYHFKDPRTESVFGDVLKRLDPETVYARTGVRLNRRHTLYQLAHDLQENPEIIGAADKFLTIGDYFNYLLSGVPAMEHSLACTTQLLDHKTQTWVQEFISPFHIPAGVFPDLVESNTLLGPLRDELSKATGLDAPQVIATCSHSSAAAITAVPEAGENWACLSSGSRSWIARELPQPILSQAAREADFSNEIGFGGMTMFRKPLPGLWLYDECRREWAAQRLVKNFEDIEKLAMQAKPTRSLVSLEALQLDDSSDAGDVASRLRDFCLAHGEMVPDTPGQIVRCIVDSLALSYRQVLRELEDITNTRIETIHVIGGGSRHRVLNQLTAEATQCIVEAGPVEVTVIGNLLLQAVALGDLEPAELRRVVRDSFQIETFTPTKGEFWEEAADRFHSLYAVA